MSHKKTGKNLRNKNKNDPLACRKNVFGSYAKQFNK